MAVSTKRIGLVGAAVAVLAGSYVAWGPALSAAQRHPVSAARLADRGMLSVRHFSADLAIRHRRMTASGAPMGTSTPDLLMRIVRQLRAGRWRTSLEFERMPDALIDAPGGRSRLLNPFAIARVEFTDDDPAPRVMGRDGRTRRPVTPEDLRLVGVAEALSREASNRQGDRRMAGTAFVAESNRAADRRGDLVRRFGPPQGRVRGLDRYVVEDSAGRSEALVAPDTVLPLELRATSPGGPEMLTTIAYEPHERFGHVRRLMRSEHRFTGTAGYAVTEVELANVVLSDEVRP